jgi:hypothetical protein
VKIFGLPIPNSGPVFAIALAIHLACGLTAVTAGAFAATAKKRRGRHPRAGRIYLWALGGIFTTATIMAAIRWREDAHLFAIAVIASGLGLYGYQARRRHRPGWPPHHAIGMGGSYIALLTGSYVDNGPFLPLWNQLPHRTYPATAEPRRHAAHLAGTPPLYTINIPQAKPRASPHIVAGPRPSAARPCRSHHLVKAPRSHRDPSHR